jgi:hypothetical protein
MTRLSTHDCHSAKPIISPSVPYCALSLSASSDFNLTHEHGASSRALYRQRVPKRDGSADDLRVEGQQYVVVGNRRAQLCRRTDR